MSHYYKMSHAMMLDEPVGYAHSGPPMQKKIIAQRLEKSKGLGVVIGVVAGVFTAGAGFAIATAANATLGAIMSGTAMMAGGAMSAIGAVTGNSKLSKIGGILSIAGGVGAMANNLATGGGLTRVGDQAASMDNFTSGLGKAADDFSNSFKSVLGAGSEATSAPTIDVNQASSIGGSGAEADVLIGSSDSAVSNSVFSAKQDTGFLTSQQPTSAGAIPNTISNPVAGEAATISLDPSAAIGKGADQGILGSHLNKAATAPANFSTPETFSANGGVATGGVNGSLDPSSKLGLIDKFMNMSNGSGQLVSAGVKAIGDGIGGSAQEEQMQKQYDLAKYQVDAGSAEVELRRKNANAQFVFINPTDPDAERKRTEARQAGAIPINASLPTGAQAAPQTAPTAQQFVPVRA